jgi:murein L,D-transpeptidase YcbB/YkuD
MSRFEKLAAINKIANECFQDGDFVLASKFHNEFMKIAQAEYGQVDLGQPAIQFIGALNQAPNFLRLIAQAPKMSGRVDIPTYRPDASTATVSLVQELLGLQVDGAIGPKTLMTMKSSLDSGKLDQTLTAGFRKKFKLEVPTKTSY